MSGSPETNLAKRLIQKHSLVPPIDINALITKYADLTLVPFPLEGADGVTLDLKVPGKRTRVIVNANNPPSRIRFTLAHELGHILIPWHTGNIIDLTDESFSHHHGGYEAIEAEANSFASELLMPTAWVTEQIEKISDLADLHCHIAVTCQTSLLAAAIKIQQLLPANIVYAITNSENSVECAGRTTGTLADTLNWGSKFPDSPYAYAVEYFEVSHGRRRIHWWILPMEIDLEVEDHRTWQEILTQILSDLGYGEEEGSQEWKSINGVAAFANSSAKKQPGYSIKKIISACFQRFGDRENYSRLVSHPDFPAFIQKKAEIFFDRA